MSSSTSSKPLDLSYQRIVAIATPVLLANLAMPLQGAIDIAVVGHFEHASSLAGLGIATQLWLLILVSFNFLQYASSGLSAQAVGRQSTTHHNSNELKDILYRSLGLALLLGVLLWLVKAVLIPFGLEALGALPSSAAAAETYLSTRYYGIFFELMNYAFIGWFAGQGKTKQMMMVQLFISITNIILTLFFVYVLDLGLRGVALGTVIGYSGGVTLAALLAYRSVQVGAGAQTNFMSDLSHRYLDIFALDKMLSLFSLNKDIFIRTLLLTLSFAWITRLSAQQGDLVMATNSILLQVLSISAFALDGVAVAAESLSGQAVARKVHSQFILAVKRTGIIVVCLAIGLTTIWLFILPYFLNVMTDLDKVYALAYDYRYVAALLPLIGAGAYWLDGIMFGLTLGAKIRQVAIIVAILFFPLTWLLNRQFADSHAMPVIWFSIYWLLLSRFVVASIVLWRHQKHMLK